MKTAKAIERYFKNKLDSTKAVGKAIVDDLTEVKEKSEIALARHIMKKFDMLPEEDTI